MYALINMIIIGSPSAALLRNRWWKAGAYVDEGGVYVEGRRGRTLREGRGVCWGMW